MPIAPALRFLVILVAGFVGIKVWLSIATNSLWLDEIATMGLAYIPTNAPTRWSHLVPVGLLRWSALLSSALDPHFPTIYAITRVISQAIYFDGIPVEYFVRLPLVIVFFGALIFTLYLCLDREAKVLDVLLGALLLFALVTDSQWRQHSSEARMYGFMSVMGVCLVVAIAYGRFLTASWIGLGLALLHPFGAMFGFAPGFLTLTLFGRHLPRLAFWPLLVGFVASIFYFFSGSS